MQGNVHPLLIFSFDFLHFKFEFFKHWNYFRYPELVEMLTPKILSIISHLSISLLKRLLPCNPNRGTFCENDNAILLIDWKWLNYASGNQTLILQCCKSLILIWWTLFLSNHHPLNFSGEITMLFPALFNKLGLLYNKQFTVAPVCSCLKLLIANVLIRFLKWIVDTLTQQAWITSGMHSIR